MNSQKPAYIIASSLMPEDHGSLEAYAEAVRPLVEKVGAEAVVRGQASQVLHLLEGNWPADGSLGVFKFPSMDALLGFWNSPEYQEIKHLRTEVIEPVFAIAVQGE